MSTRLVKGSFPLINGTSADLTTANKIIDNGHLVYETDTKKLKIGDGTTTYSALSYLPTGSSSGSTSWEEFTASNMSATNITVSTALAAKLKEMQPIQYKVNSRQYYGYISSINVGTGVLTYVGSTAVGGTEFMYGPIEKIVQVDLQVPSTFATTVSTTLLKDLGKNYFKWMLPEAAIVAINVRVILTDSGGAQPTITINKNDTNITEFTSTVLSTGWTQKVFTSASAATPTIKQNDIVDISLVTTGTNKDAEDLILSISAILV